MQASGTDSTPGTLAWTATGLPTGLSIGTSSGLLAGTPSVAGFYPVTIAATDGAGFSGTASFTWTITNIVTVTSPGAQHNLSGTAITSVTVTATDSSAAATIATWTATGLPTGLSMSTSGTITGTPSAGGAYAVTITATDSAGFSGTASFTWAITNTVTVSTPAAQASVGNNPITALANHATDTQAGASLTWSATGLPDGLSIASVSGTISGTPSAAGAYTVTITATDSAGFSGSASFTWAITSPVSLTSPGAQSDVTGTAIPRAAGAGHRPRPRP